MKPQPPDHRPPRWADRLLEVFLAPHLREDVQGDLQEIFYKRLAQVGPVQARREYAWAVLHYLTPFFHQRKPSEYSTPATTAMLRNYFKIAWRNLAHNKAFSAINLLGLALGLACSLLIFLWIRDELRVDNYHVNGPQVYYVMQRLFYDGKVEASNSTPGPLPEVLKQEFPEIVHAAGFTTGDAKMTFAVGDRIDKQTGRFAGADWFKMFSIPLLAGTPETALNAPVNLAISRSMAEHFFGSPDAAFGKAVRVNNAKDYQVTAVFENLPAASSEHYDFLLNWQDCLDRNAWMKEWGNNGPHTRIQLHPDADVARVEARLKHFLKKYNKDLNASFDIHLFLHPYEKAYLHSDFENGQLSGGRIEYVRLFAVVAVFILLIACINFMNLATARAVKRAREVGVRKVIGAGQRALVGQFFGEALLLTGLSLVLALGLVLLLLPAFNALTGKYVRLELADSSFWLLLLGITAATGLVAGSYPALFLSALNPVRVLKGTLRFGSGARAFRQGLVVFQFVLSLLLIIGTVVVYRQIDYVQTKNLGYERGNLLYLRAEGELGRQYEAFKTELLRQPGIRSVSYMSDVPTGIVSGTTGVTWPGKDPNVSIEFSHTGVGYDFIKTLKVKVRGREFSPAFGTDSVNLVVNQAAAKRIGYADPIGKPLTLWGQPGTIVGVMEDFHFKSLHEPIQPLILRFDPSAERRNILVSLQPGQTRQGLATVEALWKRMNPQFPFTYRFADEEYQKLYQSETVVGNLANVFAVLAIFISCLGLFGLAAFTAEQRKKEIGVRKVLGASVTSIVGLLSKDFLRLVLLALVIASPLAWYTMNQWLQDFEYKIPLEWWMFAGAGLLAVGITLLTVSFQSIRAALINPVKSLKSE